MSYIPAALLARANELQTRAVVRVMPLAERLSLAAMAWRMRARAMQLLGRMADTKEAMCIASRFAHNADLLGG